MDFSVLAGDGKPIPRHGYWEPTIQLRGHTLRGQGIIVTNVTVPGATEFILGMNIMRHCFSDILDALHASLPHMSSSGQRTAQHHLKILKAEQKFANRRGEIGKVRIQDMRPVTLQPNTETILWCRARPGVRNQDYQALLEPIQSEDFPLVRAARSLVTVVNGRVPVRLVNLSGVATTLPKYTPVAQLVFLDSSDILSSRKAAQQLSAQTVSGATENSPEPWWRQLQIGGSLTPPEQVEGVIEVVKECQSAFSKHPTDFGKTSMIKHRILTGDKPPIKERHRPVAPGMYQTVKKLLTDMKEADVIQESQSPWAAPMVLVKKKDGTIRFCVDYRKLNDITHKDAYPLPRIEESLTALGSAAYFSTLDLTSGYWQVPMAVEDREKTAFVTPMGLFEFKSMPFGLCNAPATFQRLMERCLGHLNFQSVLLYLDDVIVYSKSYQEHLTHLSDVFQVLIQHGLKVKPSKCHLLKPQVHYLGHVVSAEGVQPDPAKVEVVKNWPIPRTVKDIRSFLGFSGYYRRFIPHFAQIAEPLTSLLRGTAKGNYNGKLPVEWAKEQEVAFQALKHLLTEPPILAYPDYTQPFRLYTDASFEGLGAVLSQMQGKQERVIAYASRNLRGAEKNDSNYSSFKLELLALVWAVTEKFKDYLSATSFTVYTDNNPLAHLNTAKLGALEQRWASRLANYDFSIKYRSGKSNINADVLSRMAPGEDPPVEDKWEDVEMPPFYQRFVNQDVVVTREGSESGSKAIQEDLYTWRTLQEESQTMGDLQEYLLTRRVPPRLRRGQNDYELKRLWRQRKRLFVHKGMVYRNFLDPVSGERLHQILIPRRDAAMVLNAYHDQSGHFGVHKTEATIRRRFYWIGMRSDVEKWCSECAVCNITKNGRKNARAPLHSIQSERPNQLVALDHVKLSPTRSGYSYALTMVDHYSKWVVVVPVKDLTAKTTAQKFYTHWVQILGCPETVLSDRGPAFEAQLFQELCQFHACKKLRTTAYHPQGNGLCERINQVFIHMLRAASVSRPEEWPQLMPELLEIYNNTIHCSTGYTPFYLMMGRHGQLPKDRVFGLQAPFNHSPQASSEWVSEHQKRIQEAREIVNKKMGEAHYRQQQDYNRHASAQPLQVGDKVWLKKHPRTHKLDSLWETEPYTVISIPYPDSDVYSVQKARYEPQVVHRNRIKLCHKGNLPVLVPPSAPPSLPPPVQPAQVRPTKPVEPERPLLMFEDDPLFPSDQNVFFGYVPISSIPSTSVLAPEAPEFTPAIRSPAAVPSEPSNVGESSRSQEPSLAPIVQDEGAAVSPEEASVQGENSAPENSEMVLRRSARPNFGYPPARYRD